MVNLLLAAALASTQVANSPAVAPGLADADPAIFVVQDADTTVYLFGTFHALDGNADWFNDEVRAAFEGSGELVLETVIPDAPAVAGPRPLSGALATAAPSASFLATTKLAIKAGRDSGMSVRNGADSVLRRAAEAAGKRVEGLETIESQLMMFSRMPSPSHSASPAPSAGSAPPMRQLAGVMTRMQAAWKQGDQSIFVAMLDGLRRNQPATYRMMFTERNARWADWIAARMDTPGSVFVAVGAGHFAGSDSVLVKLAQMGIESRRVQ